MKLGQRLGLSDETNKTRLIKCEVRVQKSESFEKRG